MIVEKGKQFKFKMSEGLADIRGYILMDDPTFITVMQDGKTPIAINKRFVISYKQAEVVE